MKVQTKDTSTESTPRKFKILWYVMIVVEILVEQNINFENQPLLKIHGLHRGDFLEMMWMRSEIEKGG